MPRAKEAQQGRGAGKEGKGTVRIGTSGWSYADWLGPFYPKGLVAGEMLPFYARHFLTVEINATFYRTPFRNMVVGWNRKVGSEFAFSAKGHRNITHYGKLRDVAQSLDIFFERMGQLERLEVVLWQLPPSFRADRSVLADFLSRLPDGYRHVLEFRHTSWFNDETAALLEKSNCCFCAVSHPRLPDTIFPTADFLYVRFHGRGDKLYQYLYNKKELAGWFELVEEVRGGRDLYVYFNNDWRAHAIANARTLQEMYRASS